MADEVPRNPRRRTVYMRRIALDNLYRKMLNLLDRDVHAMFIGAPEGRLDPRDALVLEKYLRLMKTLRTEEAEELAQSKAD
jgi:hypothetical protein